MRPQTPKCPQSSFGCDGLSAVISTAFPASLQMDVNHAESKHKHVVAEQLLTSGINSLNQLTSSERHQISPPVGNSTPTCSHISESRTQFSQQTTDLLSCSADNRSHSTLFRDSIASHPLPSSTTGSLVESLSFSHRSYAHHLRESAPLFSLSFSSPQTDPLTLLHSNELPTTSTDESAMPTHPRLFPHAHSPFISPSISSHHVDTHSNATPMLRTLTLSTSRPMPNSESPLLRRNVPANPFAAASSHLSPSHTHTHPPSTESPLTLAHAASASDRDSLRDSIWSAHTSSSSTVTDLSSSFLLPHADLRECHVLASQTCAQFQALPLPPQSAPQGGPHSPLSPLPSASGASARTPQPLPLMGLPSVAPAFSPSSRTHSHHSAAAQQPLPSHTSRQPLLVPTQPQQQPQTSCLPRLAVTAFSLTQTCHTAAPSLATASSSSAFTSADSSTRSPAFSHTPTSSPVAGAPPTTPAVSAVSSLSSSSSSTAATSAINTMSLHPSGTHHDTYTPPRAHVPTHSKPSCALSAHSPLYSGARPFPFSASPSVPHGSGSSVLAPIYEHACASPHTPLSSPPPLVEYGPPQYTVASQLLVSARGRAYTATQTPVGFRDSTDSLATDASFDSHSSVLRRSLPRNITYVDAMRASAHMHGRTAMQTSIQLHDRRSLGSTTSRPSMRGSLLASGSVATTGARASTSTATTDYPRDSDLSVAKELLRDYTHTHHLHTRDTAAEQASIYGDSSKRGGEADVVLVGGDVYHSDGGAREAYGLVSGEEIRVAGAVMCDGLPAASVDNVLGNSALVDGVLECHIADGNNGVAFSCVTAADTREVVGENNLGMAIEGLSTLPAHRLRLTPTSSPTGPHDAHAHLLIVPPKAPRQRLRRRLQRPCAPTSDEETSPSVLHARRGIWRSRSNSSQKRLVQLDSMRGCSVWGGYFTTHTPIAPASAANEAQHSSPAPQLPLPLLTTVASSSSSLSVVDILPLPPLSLGGLDATPYSTPLDELAMEISPRNKHGQTSHFTSCIHNAKKRLSATAPSAPRCGPRNSATAPHIPQVVLPPGWGGTAHAPSPRASVSLADVREARTGDAAVTPEVGKPRTSFRLLFWANAPSSTKEPTRELGRVRKIRRNSVLGGGLGAAALRADAVASYVLDSPLGSATHRDCSMSPELALGCLRSDSERSTTSLDGTGLPGQAAMSASTDGSSRVLMYSSSVTEPTAPRAVFSVPVHHADVCNIALDVSHANSTIIQDMCLSSYDSLDE